MSADHQNTAQDGNDKEQTLLEHLIELRELVFVDQERAVNEALVTAIVLKMLGIKVPAKRRAASFADVRPFKGWPNALTTSSRSNWDIH